MRAQGKKQPSIPCHYMHPPRLIGHHIPVNTKHLYNICLRRWADVVQMLYKCFLFTALDSVYSIAVLKPFETLMIHQSIVLHLGILERKFSWNCSNKNFFFYLPPTSSHLHPLQVENSDSNSRLVVEILLIDVTSIYSKTGV